jgi:hypothetical protein
MTFPSETPMRSTTALLFFDIAEYLNKLTEYKTQTKGLLKTHNALPLNAHNRI